MNDSNDPTKAFRPIVSSISIDMAAEAIGNPGFMAFCRVLGLRISNGQTSRAFLMLTASGAAQDVAHAIIEGWPTTGTRKTPKSLMTIHEEQALFFAHWVNGPGRSNWSKILKNAAKAADNGGTKKAGRPF